MKKNQHIVPRMNGWAVKREHGKKASKVFADKTDAVTYGKDISEKDNSCLVIHDSEAKFQEVTCSPYEKSWSMFS